MSCLGALAWLICWALTLGAAHLVLRDAGEERLGPAAALGTLWMLAAPSLIGRSTGVMIATLLSAGIASVLGLRSGLRLLRGSPAPAEGRRAPLGAYLIGGTVALLVAWAALDGTFWDEHVGHDGLAAAIARGVIPPEHPLFPGEPFRYHFGFDLLAAQAIAFARLPVHRAIDAATLISVAVLLPSLYGFGRQLGGPLSGLAALGLGLLGGGLLQAFLFVEFGPFELRTSLVSLDLHSGMPPPVISNFFQHPQGLGMALSPGVLAVLFPGGPTAAGGRRPATRMIGALMLGMLSLAHVVFYVLLAAAAVVATAVELRTRRPLPARELAIAAGLALGTPFLLGGFFAAGAGAERHLVIASYFRAGPGLALWKHVVYFGLPLLALGPHAVLAWKSQRPDRIALFAAAIAGFLLPSVVSYERSWDIVKFYGVAGFLANIALADLLGLSARIGRGAVRAALLATSVLLASPPGVLWLLRAGVLNGRLGVPRFEEGRPPSAGLVALAREAGPIIPARDRVLVADQHEIPEATGFLSPGFDWRTFGSSYAIDRSRQDRFLAAARRARVDLGAEDVATLEAEWLILPLPLSPTGQANLAGWTKELESGVPGEPYLVYRRGPARPAAR